MSEFDLKYPGEALRHELLKTRPLAQSEEVAALVSIVDVVFFASMAHEEGSTTPLSVVLDGKPRIEDQVDDLGELAWTVSRIIEQPATPLALKRIARGIVYGRDALVLNRVSDEWKISGFARRVPETSDGGELLCISAPRPGVVVIEGVADQRFRYEGGSMREADIALLGESKRWGIDGHVDVALKRLWNDVDYKWELATLLRHARASGCGAMFVFQTENSKGDATPTLTFEEPASVAHAKRDLNKLYQRLLSVDDEERSDIREDIARIQTERIALVEMIGRLAAIDGAVVIRPGFEVLGAGAVINAPISDSDPMPVPRRCRTAHSTNTSPEPLSGGSRQKSAAKYAWANRGCVIFCVSSDGPITAFLRRENELLMWSVWVREV